MQSIKFASERRPMTIFSKVVAASQPGFMQKNYSIDSINLYAIYNSCIKHKPHNHLFQKPVKQVNPDLRKDVMQ